jgi:hypothetical protein
MICSQGTSVLGRAFDDCLHCSAASACERLTRSSSTHLLIDILGSEAIFAAWAIEVLLGQNSTWLSALVLLIIATTKLHFQKKCGISAAVDGMQVQCSAVILVPNPLRDQ